MYFPPDPATGCGDIGVDEAALGTRTYLAMIFVTLLIIVIATLFVRYIILIISFCSLKPRRTFATAIWQFNDNLYGKS